MLKVLLPPPCSPSVYITYGQVCKCDIFVSHSHPYNTASSDGQGKDSILHEKCFYSSREQAISPVTVPYPQQQKKQLVLDKMHDYEYYQNQGQLYLT